MASVPNFGELALRFDAPPVQGIALMGSYARGDAGPYSDVDLVRFLSEDGQTLPGSGSHLIDERLVMVTDVRPSEIAEWFSRPEVAVSHIPGLRASRLLLDREGSLIALRDRARTFIWDAEMQRRADAWASERMVGWIEEIHKGLEGLRRNSLSRLLDAHFGLSWGLQRVVQVQRGVFLSGGSTFFEEIEATIGQDTEWSRLRRVVFAVDGIDGHPSTLREQVVAGLHLYIATAELIAAALQPADVSLVKQTVTLISSVLGPGSRGR